MNGAVRLVSALSRRTLTCSCAESCTGGGIGAAITSVAGASAVFAGAVVSYSNEVKRDVLGVSGETLEAFGAVSGETAAEMAAGVRGLLKTDLAVSVTGIAGPDGGSAEKPVGTVWFGIAGPDGVRTEKKVFPGDRCKVRASAVAHALGMLADAAEKTE